MIGRTVILALALALVAAPALAQSETGTRIGGRPAQVPDRGTMSDSERARIWLERYAACVAKRDPMRVAKLLDAPMEASDAALANLSQGYYDPCLSSGGDADELRMSNTLLRGALYADRVGHLVRRLTPGDIAQRPLAWSGAVNPVHLRAVRFGDCVMRQDPSTALAYVNAAATTEAETKALTALKPALAACVLTGDTIKLSRSIIEASMAEAIYRAVRVPAAVADKN